MGCCVGGVCAVGLKTSSGTVCILADVFLGGARLGSDGEIGDGDVGTWGGV